MNQITYGTKEFQETMEFFEKDKPVRGRYDRERNRELNKIGVIYEDGSVNAAFKMFLSGVNFGIQFSY